jgi:hypothetical protein
LQAPSTTRPLPLPGAPDGDATQPGPDVVRVAGGTLTPATGVLVYELQADGQDKGEHIVEERLAIVQQMSVGRFIMEIDGDGAVVPCLCGGCGQCVTPTSSGLVC